MNQEVYFAFILNRSVACMSFGRYCYKPTPKVSTESHMDCLIAFRSSAENVYKAESNAINTTNTRNADSMKD